MSKNSRSNPKPNLFIFIFFLTQVLMNLPLLYYSWLKTQKGLVDDSVFYKLIFHWLRWSYNRVALVLTLQQKRSHSIWKHVWRVCVSFFFWQSFLTGEFHGYFILLPAMQHTLMWMQHLKDPPWQPQLPDANVGSAAGVDSAKMASRFDGWQLATQKIVVVVVAKVMVGKTLWFRAFSLCLQLDLFIIIY